MRPTEFHVHILTRIIDQNTLLLAIEMAIAVSNLCFEGTALSRYASCRIRSSPPVTFGLRWTEFFKLSGMFRRRSSRFRYHVRSFPLTVVLECGYLFPQRPTDQSAAPSPQSSRSSDATANYSGTRMCRPRSAQSEFSLCLPMESAPARIPSP